MADSYVTAASQSAGSVAEQAADRKSQKYGDLSVFSPTWVGKFRNVRSTRLMVIFISTDQWADTTIQRDPFQGNFSCRRWDRHVAIPACFYGRPA